MFHGISDRGQILVDSNKCKKHYYEIVLSKCKIFTIQTLRYLWVLSINVYPHRTLHFCFYDRSPTLLWLIPFVNRVKFLIKMQLEVHGILLPITFHLTLLVSLLFKNYSETAGQIAIRLLSVHLIITEIDYVASHGTFFLRVCNTE